MDALLTHHQQLLNQWRSAMNLIGPGPIELHYTDSREALTPLSNPQGRWVDLGTGAGFPGIVFAALFPQATISLVDSRSKRCAFLDRVLATSPVGVNHISVLCARLETLEDHSYEGVISRALAAPETMLEHASRLLVTGGKLLLLLQDDAKIPKSSQFELLAVHHYSLGEKERKSALLQKLS